MPPKATPTKAKPAPKEAEPQEEVYQWWNDKDFKTSKRGDERRWETLEHNGVCFPPPYVQKHVPIEYDGVELKLSIDEEEVAFFWAEMRESDHTNKPTFKENFFKDFKRLLDKNRGKGNHPVKNMGMISFDKMWLHVVADKAAKLARSSDEKKALTAQRKLDQAPYNHCIWDGRRQATSSFQVEPPGLFRGRGEHPMAGKVKSRIYPEDVTLNLGETAPVPPAPAGHKWGGVEHNHKATWLTKFEDTVNGESKYMQLAPSGDLKGMSDRDKFEKARKLATNIDAIRADYRKSWLAAGQITRQQQGVCAYFVDKLALRVGGEKDTDAEADTVGVCSLKRSHVQCLADNILRFDFLGKDSIQYLNEVAVDPVVHQLIAKFQTINHEDQNKVPPAQRDLFVYVKPDQLNKYFKNFQDDLTAKVFRTYNASKTLQDYFKANKLPKSATLDEKLVYFNKANTDVAVLCNHQRSVGAGHAKAMHSLSHKTTQASGAVLLLEECLAIEKKKDWEAAAAHFNKAIDAQQDAWLAEYGTDEEKADWAAKVQARGEAGPGRKPAAKKLAAEKKAAPAKRGRGDKVMAAVGKKGKAAAAEEASDSEDETFAAILASKATAAGKGSGKAPPKKAAKREASPASPPAKKGGKAASPAAKKAAAASTSPKKSPKKAASPAKKAASPAKKAASPAKKAASPAKKAASPAKKAASPAKKASPAKASPKKSPAAKAGKKPAPKKGKK
jgi:DNA topoisomerase-1